MIYELILKLMYRYVNAEVATPWLTGALDANDSYIELMAFLIQRLITRCGDHDREYEAVSERFIFAFRAGEFQGSEDAGARTRGEEVLKVVKGTMNGTLAMGS